MKKLIDDSDLPSVVFHSFRHSSITYKLKLSGGDIRRLNAQRFEEQFYQTKETPQAEEAQQKTEPSVSPTDQEMLLKLLANPEMATLLKSLAKNL